jgi:hypothetical protein
MAQTDIISTTWMDRLCPAGGSLTIKDTDERTGLFVTSISVNSDSVFTTCTGYDKFGEAIDFMTDENFLWTGTLIAGSTKFCGDGCYVNIFKLASGDVDLNKIK